MRAPCRFVPHRDTAEVRPRWQGIADGIDAMGQDLLLHCMSQNLVIETAPLPFAPAGLVVLYAGEGMPPRGTAAEIWAKTGLDFERIASSIGFKGKPGQVMDIAGPSGI